MKDGALLLLSGLIYAALAAAIFHFCGEQAWAALNLLLAIGLLLDNRRLRARLRRLGAR